MSEVFMKTEVVSMRTFLLTEDPRIFSTTDLMVAVRVTKERLSALKDEKKRRKLECKNFPRTGSLERGSKE